MFDEQPALNLFVGTRCNNRCVFCLDRSDTAPRFEEGVSVADHAEAVALMRADRARGGTIVAFARLEPTLDLAFPDLVRAARDLGYEDIQLTSNARLLGNEKRTRALLEAGLTRLTVSLHAPVAAVHDELSGRPRAFEQTVKGLRTVVALRREYPLRLQIGCTLTSLNLGLLSEHYAFLQEMTPAQISLNSLIYCGRAADEAERLSFHYDALAAAVQRLLDEHAGRLYTRFSIVGVPFCALSSLPPSVAGLREGFRVPSSDDGEVAWQETGASGDEDFGIRHIEACETCSHRGFCPGVAEQYVALHGTDAIHPLDDAARRRLETAPSIFPGPDTYAYRYPVRDAATLPTRYQRLAGALTAAANEGWRLDTISAWMNEHQNAYRLRVRYTHASGDEAVDGFIEPHDPKVSYYRNTADWGFSLDDTPGHDLGDAVARRREALLTRILKVLARI